jgi:glycosyltransferase involved in cell wall biosynthesis
LERSHQRNRFILYDYLQVAGGAERLSLILAEAFPEFQLIVSRIYAEAAALGIKQQIPILFLGSGISRLFGRIPEAIWCFNSNTHFLRHAETVLYSGYYAPLAVKNQLEGQKIYYCHTPPRYAYDLADAYRKMIPDLGQPIFNIVIRKLRQKYEQSLNRMDHVIANSNNVQRRLKNFLNIDSEVIYPPIDVNRFRWLSEGDYFVSLARLVKGKRVDRIVQAFLQIPEKKLVVVSGGSELKKLQRIACGARNVYFTGWQSDAQLQEWIGKARAAIYIPTDEDFGMSPVEAMAAGKPVIGVAEGGLLETVVDGETGILLPPDPSPEHIAEAVLQMTKPYALEMRAACGARAQLFSKESFVTKMRKIVGHQ